MSDSARGCHHCIGAATAVTNLIFNFIHTKAIAKDGLSADDVHALRQNILDSFRTGYDYFERINRQCMDACRSPANDPFARSEILTTLLGACAGHAAREAFKHEIREYGIAWLDDFLRAFAAYTRQTIVDSNIEPQLIAAFVEAASKHKGGLSVVHLLREDKIKTVMTSLVGAYRDEDRRAELAKTVCESVNASIANKYVSGDAGSAKTTVEEVRDFLRLLPVDTELALSNA